MMRHRTNRSTRSFAPAALGRVNSTVRFTMIKIRDAREKDYGEIICLNESEVEKTSPMDEVQLASLNNMSSFHKVAIIDNWTFDKIGGTAP